MILVKQDVLASKQNNKNVW